MIKPSKVVFISDELEKNFNSLKENDPIKKAMIRAIRDLDFFLKSMFRSMELTTYGNMTSLVVGDFCILLLQIMK